MKLEGITWSICLLVVTDTQRGQGPLLSRLQGLLPSPSTLLSLYLFLYCCPKFRKQYPPAPVLQMALVFPCFHLANLVSKLERILRVTYSTLSTIWFLNILENPPFPLSTPRGYPDKLLTPVVTVVLGQQDLYLAQP